MAAASGGIYMTHIRDEADKSFDALNEEITIGEKAHIPIEHSHIKLGTVGVQRKAAAYIQVIEAARKGGVDFLADCYPYDAWHSDLKVTVPDKQYENPRLRLPLRSRRSWQLVCRQALTTLSKLGLSRARSLHSLFA